MVQVRAKDSSNNTFSGLQGVPFVWTIQDGDEDPNDGPACSPTDPAACSVVVPLLLSSQNSSQKASPRRKEMENEWKAETDQIVLEAKTPGDATVSVKLKGDTNIAAKKWIVDVVSCRLMCIIVRLCIPHAIAALLAPTGCSRNAFYAMFWFIV